MFIGMFCEHVCFWILAVYFNENIRSFKGKMKPLRFLCILWFAYFIFLCITVGLHVFLGIIRKPLLAEFRRSCQISWTWDKDSCTLLLLQVKPGSFARAAIALNYWTLSVDPPYAFHEKINLDVYKNFKTYF